MKPNVGHLLRLIGNPNAYALQQEDGKYRKVLEPVTPRLLRDHLDGKVTVGTYVVNPPDQARVLVVDLDTGDGAFEDAMNVVEALQKLGVPERSMGLEFSGRKGYHVWLPIGTWVPANYLRRVGRAATAMAGVKAEVFPKQDAIGTSNGERDSLGNLVKLPGGKHRVTGTFTEYKGPVPQPLSATVIKGIVDALPQEAVRVSNGKGAATVECLAKIQEGVGAGQRNNALFQFATHLRRAGVVDDGIVFAALNQLNQNCNPPCDEAEVQQVVESSRNSGPICDQLDSDLRCESCPFRQTSLFVKPGQLRHGTVGEKVVVEVSARKSGMVEVTHPDLDKPRLLA